MKKQRILAMALAATTAFSMFGASLSVSAAAQDYTFDTDAYLGSLPADDSNFNYHAPTTGVTQPEYIAKTGGFQKAVAGGKVDLAAMIVAGTLSTLTIGDIEKFDSTMFYMVDFAHKLPDGVSVTLDDIQEKIDAYVADSATTANFDALVDKINLYTQVSDVWTNEITFDTTLSSGVRKDVLNKFTTTVSAAKDLDLDLYDPAEVLAYNVKQLKKNITDLEALSSRGSQATSYLAYLSSEYDRVMGIISPSKSYGDDYDELLAEYEAIPSSDYTEANFAKVELQLKLAAIDAAKGTETGYKDAVKKLKAIDDIETIAPKYSDLTDALVGLFTSKTNFTTNASATVVYPGTKAATEALQVYSYIIDDYKTKGVVSDEWIAFAGQNKGVNADYVKGAYRAAMEVYDKCKYSSTRKTVRQSAVDKALADLDEAILALNPTYDTPNYVVVRLEAAVEKASAVNESDYRTATSIFKNFKKALEKAEALLAQDKVKEDAGNTAAVNLEKATKDLTGCQIAVPAATKTSYKDALAAAKKMIKDITGKTASQIKVLQDAIDRDVTTAGKDKISDYESAIADLNSAMKNYQIKAGWEKQTDGTYKYYDAATSAYTKEGWKNIDGTWYLFKNTVMQTGWQQVNGTWYYLKASGAMATGWTQVGNTWYYLKASGAMQTGWLNLSGTWYYLSGSGAMVTGWNWIGGKCYYFNASGAMAANTTVGTYKVNASGAWVDANGKVVTK